MGDETRYLAVIGDLVGSRKLVDRAAVQERLAATLGLLNDAFSEHIRSRFVITIGDEFQGLLSADAPLDRIWWRFAGEMFPDVLTRFGFGLGTISTRLREDALGMDGSSFWAAREAVDQARSRDLLFAFCIDGQEEWSAAVNESGLLLNRVVADWTAVQWETVTLFERFGNQSVVAEKRKVVRQTVSTSLSRSLGLECLRSFRGLLDLVRKIEC